MNKIKRFFVEHKWPTIAVIFFVFLISIISIVSYENERKETVFAPYILIDDTQITAIEFAYHYNLYLSDFIEQYGNSTQQFGFDLNKPFEEQTLSDGTTWAEYFNNKALENILEINFMYMEAQANNYTSDDLENKIENEINKLKNTAEVKGIKFKKYLSETFIKNTKEKDLINIIEKIIVAKEYKEKFKTEYNVTDKDIEQYYLANKKDYDNVDFRIFKFSVYDEYTKLISNKSQSSTVISEDNQSDEGLELDNEVYNKAKETVLKTANDFYNQVYDEETFKELSIKYTDDEEKKNE